MADEPRLSILNPQPRKLPGPSLLHELVSEPGSRPPALDYRAPDGSRLQLSYAELHGTAETLAVEIGRRLEQQPLHTTPPAPKQQLVVPVLIPQAPELYVALLAILKAGGAFCPIQLDAPPDRIRFILGDVGAAVVLSTRAMAARLPADDGVLQVILVDEMRLFERTEAAGHRTSPSPRKAPAPSPDDLAYVMYTSGSTGTPKGVGIPHTAATQSLLAHDRHVPAFRRFLQFAAPTFDVSVFEVFFPWFRGATLVCSPRTAMLDDLPGVLRAMDVDACELTPTVAGSLLRRRDSAPNLKLLLTIGEMLTEPVIQEFGGSGGSGSGSNQPSILWAMYGPTEAAIHCTLQPALDGAASTKNIGFPLDTVSAYILEIPEEGSDQKATSGDPQVVPMGCVGELAIGGHQLACGYINRPEQTAAAFIDTAAYGRLYRTGDKARITEQGLLECSGRIAGGQVKLRGQRIELGEVEQAVLRTRGCLGSVAAVVNGILVAFCDVGVAGVSPAQDMEEKVLASCRSWLPRFMVPGDVVLMASFPRLASGKVDRKRLASDYEASSSQNAASASLSGTAADAQYKDELDRKLHDVAQQVLGFFVESTAPLAAAGLDSLKAIQFAARIRAAGIQRVSAVDVLAPRSLAALHARIQQLQEESSALEEQSVASTTDDSAQTATQSCTIDTAQAISGCEPDIARRLEEDDIQLVLACAPIQTSMLVETLSNPAAYCNWIELAFSAKYSTNDVVSAFVRLIENTEALRAGFVQSAGRFVQAVWRHPSKSQVQTVEHLQRDFELATDASFLHPFCVQVEKANSTSSCRAVLQIHHAVYDGWSMDLIRRDLAAILEGRDVETRLAYSSVIQHCLSALPAQKSAAERFWAETLNAFQPSSLPELNPRRDDSGPVLMRRSSIVGIRKDRVEDVAKAIGCSLQAIFQAALAWLWSGLAGSPDVVLGTVTSGRTLPLDGIETAIGPCLQTVPVRADLARMRTIRDLVSSIYASNRSLLPHAFLPLADIKKMAGLRPGQPLYDVLFVYQESLYSSKGQADVVSEVTHKDSLETRLLWEVEPVGDGFAVQTTFYADMFPEKYVAVLVSQYASIVQHFVNHMDDGLTAAASSLPPQLLSAHNLEYRPFDGVPDLACLVQSTAARKPDSPAVCFATSLREEQPIQCNTITFSQLNRLANRIARHLQSHGARPGGIVAVIMEKSILLYAGILGILKTGCAYLPLLPSTPHARAKLVLEQAKVPLCLTDTATETDLVSGLPTTAVDLQTADLSALSDDNLDVPVDASRTANIIYTSGSTGTPKGVCVTQLNVCSNLDVLARIYPLRGDDGGRLLQSCSQAFDVSVFEIFFTWVCGMCLCSATNDVLFADLEQAIRVLGVTHLSMTPTVAALVDPQNTPSVEFLVTAGEPLTERVARQWARQLFQGYGPSETTNICTVKKMAPGDTIRHLGFGFENTSSVVLQIDGLGTVPLGAVGELCFGGDQVVAGYLALPSLTAAKFIQHPTYGRLYRSGDLGRMLWDGSLMITGRIDDQVKLRGQRIELNEINAVLCASSQVAEALTLLVHLPDSSASQLVSFFVPSQIPIASSTASSAHALDVYDLSIAASVDQLFYDLKGTLPAYMLPTFLVPFSAIPLTPAGKVDKAILTNLFAALSTDVLSAISNSSSTEHSENDRSPWSDLERQVAQTVADALGVNVHGIGHWTPLASLGLDSLSAIQVARRLHAALGLHIAISDILKNMSVAQLARVLDKAISKPVDPPSTAFSVDVFPPQFTSQLQETLRARGLSLKQVLPCMPLQEAMLVSPSRGRSYVNRMLFRLKADASKVKAAWLQLCTRHDILRTCFVTTDHRSYPIAQVILGEDYAPSWLDLRWHQDATDSADLDSVDDLVEAEMQALAQPVDTFQPPVSFAVIEHTGQTFLIFGCHHAVYDGEAIDRLLLEAEQLIAGIPLVPRSPPRFHTFLAGALALPASTDAFWNAHLAGFRPTRLSNNKLSSAEQSADQNAVAAQTLDMALSALQDRTRQLGVSLLSAFQTAWACLLTVITETDDVCFGNVYNGRSVAMADVDSLVAPCFNTLPVRANLSTMQSAKDVLSYFQVLNPDLMHHQFTPLRRIQRQHLGGVRLFDSLLLLQQPSRPLDKTIWTLERDDGEMDLPLVLEILPNAKMDQIKIRLHHDRNILTESDASFVTGLFNYVLTVAVNFSSSRLPGREDLPQQMKEQIEDLHLSFDKLPREEEAKPDELVASAETWSPAESLVRTVLSEISTVPEDHIRRDTTIYRLGLDSVMAVQVAAVLRKRGVPVSAVDVMEYPTCKGLAGLLSTAAKASNAAPDQAGTSTPSMSVASTGLSSPSETPATPASASPLDFAQFRASVQPLLEKQGYFLDSEVEAVLPCTPLQTGLLSEFVRSNGRHYFNFVTFVHNPATEDTGLDAGLDATSWARAWLQAAVSVPMLRTGFISVDSNDRSSTFSPFAMVQLSPTAMVENHLRIRVVRAAEAAVFDASQWQSEAMRQALANLQQPPWQVALVEDRDKPGVVACHLAIHHALYDAASLRSTLTEVASCLVGKHELLLPGTVARASTTAAAVSDILRQVAIHTGPSSDIAVLWKDRAAQAVVNSFPVLTPLKVAAPAMKVFSQTSAQPSASLQDAVSAAGFSMHAVFQAAWTRILSSYVGDVSVVFGTVLAGRDTEATADAVFPCITTLPVIAENCSKNRALVEQLMDTTILLHKSQHVALGQIQRWLGQPESRLFDTLLVYQSASGGSLSGNMPWTSVDETAVVNYPISIEAIPQADGSLAYQMTFDDSVLPAEHAALLLRQLDAVVCHLAFHPDAGEDDLVAVDASAGLYSVLPAAHDALPSEVTLLHQFVEQQARQHPDKTALQFVTAFDSAGRPVRREWTFGDLDARGDRVEVLVSRHATPGSIVAICFDKCPEAFFTMLGVLKAGCAFLALDPSAPTSRKQFILEDAGAMLLLTETTRVEQLDVNAGVRVIGINEAFFDVEETAIPPQNRRLTQPSDICYCLYTSGTTGTPKGCAITHENAVQCMQAFQELFRNHYDADSRWLQFASFHFDVAVLEQYWTWSVGMTLVAAPRDLILDDLAATISRLSITHIDLTPSLGRLLDPKDVPSLCRGVFITGGEPLKQEMLDPWGPTGAVHNFYGPTEATIGVTSYPQVPQNGRASNIGRQFPNVGTFVFRPGTQTPVLRGGIGELCVSGKLVGQGYIYRPDLTRERFPTLSEKAYPGYGQRVYRTGDLVRLLHDGCFDFLGRADDQVKLRGQRLEIGEINHAIRLGVGARIGDVATLVVRDAAHSKDFLVSFVVHEEAVPVDSTTPPTVRSLPRLVQAACRDRLPGYMVPTYVIQVPSIPLSPNNKADAKALRTIFNGMTPEERMQSTGADVTGTGAGLAETETGTVLLDVLRQLFLGNDSPDDPTTTIFELGIDSISALRLAQALKRAGLPASPSLVLAHPVLSDLVAALDAQKTGNSAAAGSVLEARLLVDACQHRHRSLVCAALGVDARQVEYIAPCSALQQGMISRSRSGDEHRTTYYNAFRFRLATSTSLTQLVRAWEAVVQNNAILRTRFVATDDGFVQAALKTEAVPFAWQQLDLGDDEDASLVLNQRYGAWVDANQAADTIMSPLELYSATSRGSQTLVLHIFHGLYDAASLDLILGQVAAAYDAGGEFQSGPLTDHPTFLEALVHGPLRNHADSRHFWENHLKDAVPKPVPPFHKDGPRPPDGAAAVTAERTLSFEAIERLRVSLVVTHSAIVQALWVSVLQNLISGGGDYGVTLGLVLSGRTTDDLDNVAGVVGPLFNTLPFFAPVHPGQSWAALVQACYAFSTTTLPFQQVPLRDVQKWCASGQPLFDVLFSFQLGEGTASSQRLWTQTEPDVHADYALALEAVLDETALNAPTLRLQIVAGADISDETGLERLLDDFESALDALSRDPSSAVPYNGRLAGDSASDSAPAQASRREERSSATLAQLSQPFVWDDTALAIRHEIAALAGMPENAVRETTTLLELGLDSVDTIKLVSRLRMAGVRLSNSQLVRGQTILAFVGLIAAAIAEHKDADDAQEPQGASATSAARMAAETAALRDCLVHSGRDLSSVASVWPPTPLQEAMVADMLLSDFARYFNHDILALAADVDLARLKAAWALVAHENPILRTVFFAIDSPDLDVTYCQAVLHDVAAVAGGSFITEVDVESRQDLAAIAERCRESAVAGVGESSLLQLVFAHAADDDRWYLVLSIAHALYDGLSLELLHRRVEAAYRDHSDTGERIVPDEAEPPYVDTLARIIQSAGPQADSFWSSFLAGARPTYVRPRDDTFGSQDQDHDGPVVRIESTSSVPSAQLLQFCRQQSASVQVIGQACWAAVLASLTGSLDLIFGVVLSGRDAERTGNADGLLFPTMNTVPVRVVLHGTAGALLQYMQANMGCVGEYQHYPLRKAQAVVDRSATNSGEPGIFNTLFILQKRLQDEPEHATEVSIVTSVGGGADVEYPICVELEVVDDAVVWRTACDRRYVARHGATRILHQLDTALAFIMEASSTNSSILRFDDSAVSVCGLPPFSPTAMDNTKGSSSSSLHGKLSKPSMPSSEYWSTDEQAIRAVLSTVSGLPESAIHRTGQTIYHLGLDSISAIKVSTLLRRIKDLALGVRAILAAKSIEDMAATAKRQNGQNGHANRLQVDHISSSLDAVGASDLAQMAGIDPARIERLLPATAMQVHMVSVWQAADGAVFFPTFNYRLRGVVGGRPAVAAAWARLVVEYPVVRVVFVATTSAALPLLQVVMRPSLGDGVSVADKSVWPAFEGPVQPLAYFSVLPEAGGSHSFAVTLRIHHALYDAVSLQAMLRRFQQLCGAVTLQTPSSTDASGLLAWEHTLSTQLSPETKDHNQQFWTNYFEGANVSAHGTVQGPHKLQTRGRASCFRPAVLNNVAPLREMCAKSGIGLQSLVFAVYAKTLSFTNAQPNVAFGIYLANRQDADGQDNTSAYPTLCLVPLVVRAPLQRGLADIALQIQQDVNAISSAPPAAGPPLTAGLWEIQAWTGIGRVDSFVNFLLPGDGEDDRDASPAVLEEVHAEEDATATELTPGSYPALSGNPVKDAYADAVDVEIAVRNNALDIGVFGSACRLGDDGAAQLVSALAEALRKAVE